METSGTAVLSAETAPASAAARSALSTEEIARYRSDGFLVRSNVITSEEVDQLRDAAEELSDEVRRLGGEDKNVHLLGLAAKHPLFLNLARDSRIVGLLTPLIGEDIQLEHSKLATQAASKGKGGFGWHQDFAFFPHTNTDLVAVMVMLDDAGLDNGCMRMLRGSHKLGLRDHTRNNLFSGACQEPELWEGHANDIVPVTPPAGGISIHHCLTLHGSGANESGLPRRGLVFQYRADDAYQLADRVFEDTGLMVAGQRRGLVRCEALTSRLPRFGAGANPYGAAWNQVGAFASAENGPL